MTAVCAGLIAIGAGFAATVTLSPVPAHSGAWKAANSPSINNVVNIAFAVKLFIVRLVVDNQSATMASFL